METLFLFLLCFTLIVFCFYLLKHGKAALELSNIYKNWLTRKIFLREEGGSPIIRRTEAHYQQKTK